MMKKYRYTDEERAVLEHSMVPLAIYQMVNNKVETLILSDGFLDLFGFESRDEAYHVAETDMYRDTHPNDIARIANVAYRFAKEGERYDVIYRSKNKERTGYNVLHGIGAHVTMSDGTQVAQVWYTNEGPYVEGILIGEADLNKRLNKALHEESILKANYFDELTGLPAMNYFFELAGTARAAMIEQGKQPALLFMDFSGMKFFNYKNGFAEGNRLIRKFAKLLIKHFGADQCCRFGGDHFVVITQEEGLTDTLEKLFEENRKILEGNSLPVRVGIYTERTESVDVSTACDRAKIACDALRNVYGSCYKHFNQSLRDGQEHKQYIITNLDRAIRERWIKVYYQPIVRAVSGRVCDEEALARWIDPEKGFLNPGEFISILEEAGLIWKLDLYMLDRVLEKLKEQEAAGLYLVPQSINLSRKDFDACDMVEEIRKRVDASGLGRGNITIEITESTIASDFNFMKEQIERFVKLGFPVWMDDFGSGYSSLDVLQSIKFHLIKFDMRFMQQFDKSDSSRIVLTELMKMAAALNTDTVCEGVETQEQVQFLREIGCSKIQGFYYQKPIPWEKVLEKYGKGLQIGFENPAESAYYESIGRVNLYDLAVISQDEEDTFHNFFSSLPMAVMEIKEERLYFTRTNQPFRDFMKRFFDLDLSERDFNPPKAANGVEKTFLSIVSHCRQNGSKALTDLKMADGSKVHSFVRRLGVNPVTGAAAVVIVILSVNEPVHGTSYEDIAQALASDYFNLFYVDLRTEKFIEYSSGNGQEGIVVEGHGEDFFALARKNARILLYQEDQDAFIAAFTKENVTRELDQKGSFTIQYRLDNGGKPLLVNMKAKRMYRDFIIIGVTGAGEQPK